jgi:serine/threonine protein kinase
MLLEYMGAGSLRDSLNNGTAVEQAGEILVNVCEAVSHAHRYGIAHNDLKPANILFSSDGTPKVADWGLAKVLLDHSTSVEGLTPQYAAPEQLDPDEYGGTDDATDIYQLGVIAYELLTGEPPYDRPNPAGTINAILEANPVPPSERNPNLPSAVDDVILQAMACEKADRYEHILYFRDELSELPI